jgi:nitrogen fixation protein NifB
MITIDTTRHPCFNVDAKGQFGRAHLPVAPKCNVQCNFCDRKYDCINESRPGVCSAVLSPHQALHYLDNILENDDRITVVGIAGPGDPFANAEEALETLRLIRAKHPDIILCLSSNGLGLPEHIDELAELNVSHVTITVNAVDPEVGAGIYSWIRFEKRVYRGVEGAALLWNRQKESITKLKMHGITVKINSIFMQGVNDHHLSEIARVTRELGADIQNIIPLLPVSGTPFERVPVPHPDDLMAKRGDCEEYLHQMRHCARCRADAVGLLGKPNTEECIKLLEDSSKMPLRPDEDRPYIAVASHEGVLVNQHLGEAQSLWIYEAETCKLVEHRIAPPVGGGDSRWIDMADRLSDCATLLVSGIGPRPMQTLAKAGLRVTVMEGVIENTLRDIRAGTPIKSPVRKFKCGASCAGTGTGCG